MTTRDSVSVLLPIDDNSVSVATATVSATSVTVANGISINNALDNKDNSLMIFIVNSSVANDEDVTIKKSNLYPNSVLGDLVISAKKNATTCVQLIDPSRFEQKDGAILLDFATNFTGSVYAIAKRAGLKPAS